MAVLAWIALAATQGMAVLADHLPGGACRVSSCCDVWAPHFDDIHGVAEAEHDASQSIISKTPVSAACSLLALTDNTTGSGVCADAPEALEVSAVLQQYGMLPSGPLLGMVVEPGTCSQLSSDACWQSPNGSTTNVHWTNMVYYQEGVSHCSAIMIEEDPTVAWSTSCATEEPYGLQVSAKWVNGTSPDSSFCDAHDDVAPLELVTADMWTQPSTPGLPSWRCFDVPQTPSGEMDYRILAYSYGPAPCVPESSNTTNVTNVSTTTTTVGSVVSGSVGLRHGLMVVVASAVAAVLQ